MNAKKKLFEYKITLESYICNEYLTPLRNEKSIKFSRAEILFFTLLFVLRLNPVQRGTTAVSDKPNVPRTFASLICRTKIFVDKRFDFWQKLDTINDIFFSSTFGQFCRTNFWAECRGFIFNVWSFWWESFQPTVCHVLTERHHLWCWITIQITFWWNILDQIFFEVFFNNDSHSGKSFFALLFWTNCFPEF